MLALNSASRLTAATLVLIALPAAAQSASTTPVRSAVSTSPTATLSKTAPTTVPLPNAVSVAGPILQIAGWVDSPSDPTEVYRGVYPSPLPSLNVLSVTRAPDGSRVTIVFQYSNASVRGTSVKLGLVASAPQPGMSNVVDLSGIPVANSVGGQQTAIFTNKSVTGASLPPLPAGTYVFAAKGAILPNSPSYAPSDVMLFGWNSNIAVK